MDNIENDNRNSIMRMMIDQVSRRDEYSNHGDARASSTNSNLVTKHIDISSQASGSVRSRKNVS